MRLKKASNWSQTKKIIWNCRWLICKKSLRIKHHRWFNKSKTYVTSLRKTKKHSKLNFSWKILNIRNSKKQVIKLKSSIRRKLRRIRKSKNYRLNSYSKWSKIYRLRGDNWKIMIRKKTIKLCNYEANLALNKTKTSSS